MSKAKDAALIKQLQQKIDSLERKLIQHTKCNYYYCPSNRTRRKGYGERILAFLRDAGRHPDY